MCVVLGRVVLREGWDLSCYEWSRESLGRGGIMLVMV